MTHSSNETLFADKNRLPYAFIATGCFTLGGLTKKDVLKDQAPKNSEQTKKTFTNAPYLPPLASSRRHEKGIISDCYTSITNHLGRR